MTNPTLVELFQNIADEIRNKRLDLTSTNKLVAANFPEEIAKIITDPSGTSTATASDILYGKTACISGDGTFTTGTMPNNGTTGSTLTAQGSSYTIPAGYTSGGTVKANINNATITSGAGTTTFSGPTYSSANSNYTVTASTSIAPPTVGTAGYISSTAGTKNSNLASKSLTLNKIGLTNTVTLSGKTVTPVIVRTAKASNATWVDAASGVGVSSPSEGAPYVQVDAAAVSATVTANASTVVSSAGYGDDVNVSAATGSKTVNVGSNAASTLYIPITTTSASVSGNTVSYGTGWITGGSKTVGAGSVTSGTGTITVNSPVYNSTNSNFSISASLSIPAPTVVSAGYISSSIGTKTANSASGSLTLNKVAIRTTLSNGGATTPVISRTTKPADDTWVDAASGAGTTTKPTSSAYVRVDVPASTKTITATPSVSTAGYGTTDYYTSSNGTTTGGHNAASSLYVPIKVGTVKSPNTAATISGPSYNSTNANFTVSASGTIAAPTVSSEGYISSSVGTRSTGSINGSKALNKIAIKATGGSNSTTASIVAASKSSSDTYTNAAKSSPTTTVPTTTEPYVKITAEKKTLSVSATATVTSEGYGTEDQYTATSAPGSATVNAATYYVPITVATTQPTLSGATTTWSTGWVTGGTTTVPNAATTAGSLTLTPSGTSTTAPSLNSSTGKYELKATANMTATSVGAGYVTAKTITSASSKSVIFTMPGSTASKTSLTSQSDYATVSAGYLASAVKITANLTTGAVTTSTASKTLNPVKPTFTYSGNVITASTSNSGSVSVSPSITTNGWVTSSNVTAANVPITGSSSNTYTITALTTGVVKAGTIILGVTGTYTSDATATAGDIFLNKTAYVNGSKLTGTLVSPLSTKNTFLQKNYFTYASAVNSSSTAGTITIGSSSIAAGLVAYSGIKGEKVYNAVWNDLADLIPVNEECELEFGKCYCFDGEKYYKSDKYLDEGIIGIHSDVAGFEMGHKDGHKELKCSVAGFVLAYVDKEYPVGTLLTCTKDGYLTEIKKEDKINYPEKIVGSYWKNETEEYWGSEQRKVLVNGRKWIKVR